MQHGTYLASTLSALCESSCSFPVRLAFERCFSFQDMVAQSPNLTAQMATLDSVLRRVKTEDDRAKVSTWCEHQRGQALAHMKTPVESDVPTLITVIKSKGIHFFVETCVLQAFPLNVR